MRLMAVLLANTFALCCAEASPIYQPAPVPRATQAELVQNPDQYALKQQALHALEQQALLNYASSVYFKNNTRAHP
jgi:hypothetical protein